ncbi:MAG: ribonuclease D [Gammaproteobacteria bacterium]|jgi:ribonuclease D
MKNELKLINTDAALIELCIEFEDASWIALDTEFERVNTYYPELCLLQLSNGNKVGMVDPLADIDLEPVYQLLYDKSRTKVFHAARQDLELFYHLKGCLPVPLFDTQIAATLLGYDSQIGYANLVKEVLDIELSKTESRTNWKRRPLSDNQLMYAADDVIYLAKIYEEFLAKLNASGQFSLLDEEFNALTRPALYDPEPGVMWKKIKSSKKLTGDPLEYLKKLAAWRELTARDENQPRKWVLSDHVLVELSKNKPLNMHELSNVNGINNNILNRHGAVLLDILTNS